MLIDSHIHIGQYFNQYHSPSEVSKLMKEVGVDYYAVSSTTMCEENYPKVLDELSELIRLDAEKVIPVMWITPEGLQGNIAWFLESDIRWKCLKIHPELHPEEWNPDGSNFGEVLEIADELHLPLLIHTGHFDCCHAQRYEQVVKNHPQQIFILAHGRPVDEALHIVAECPNAYADSAFMPVEDMKKFCDARLAHQLLWGTDMCIPQFFYPGKDMVTYYRNKLEAFRSVSSGEDFFRVTGANASSLFDVMVIE